MINSKGFSLIEVLVTSALVSIGVVGAMFLQVKSIQYTQGSANHNMAVILTKDLIEIIRFHRSDFIKKKEDIIYPYSYLKGSTDIYNEHGVVVVRSDNCDEHTVKGQLTEQVSCWLKSVEYSLPGAGSSKVRSNVKLCPSFISGECAGDSYEGTTLEVQVAWIGKEGECDDVIEDICIYRVVFDL